MAENRYALGRVELVVGGVGSLVQAIREELSHQTTVVDGCTSTIEFIFADGAPPRSTGVRIGNVSVAHTSYFVHDRYLPYAVQPGLAKTVVTVWTNVGVLGTPGVSELIRPIDPSYNNVWRRLAKRFFYDIFDQAVQIHQLQHDQTWCHSSAFTDGTRTTLLMAWGGVGKTSSLIQFLNGGGYSFLADDLIMVDSAGMAYRTPQKMQIYPYNLEGEEQLKNRVLKNRSLPDRAHWYGRARALGAKSVRRRVHPEQLFGPDAVAVSASVTDAYFLRRVDSAGFAVHEATPEKLAYMSANVLQHELSPLDDIYAALSSADYLDIAPGQIFDQASASAKVASILTTCLTETGSTTGIVDVPYGATPSDLRAFLSQTLAG